jgi:dipeptidyl aminopeptidase/acylaminoacyl peptidase
MPAHVKTLVGLCLCLSIPAAASDLIVERQGCFSGEFAEYGIWMEGLAKRNPNFDPNDKRVIGRETFDRYKRELDCQWILYRSTDGQIVNGFLIVPKQTRESAQRLPVVIFNRGGNGTYGAMVFGRILSDLAPLSTRGFIVIGSQYRGLRTQMLGPGRDPGKDEFGGKDVDDVMALFDIIDSLPNADSKRIGLYGSSRGGMESFLVARRTQRASTMVLIAPVLDLFDLREFRPEAENLFQELIPDYTNNPEAALAARSAIRWVKKVPKRMSILLVHGDADERVPVRQSIAMAEKLKKLRRPHELKVITGGDHSLSGHRDEMIETVAAWFLEHLPAESQFAVDVSTKALASR